MKKILSIIVGICLLTGVYLLSQTNTPSGWYQNGTPGAFLVTDPLFHSITASNGASIGGPVALTNTITSYNTETTAGVGVPYIMATPAKIGIATNIPSTPFFTNGAATFLYEISGVLSESSAPIGTVTVTITGTDDTGTGYTLTPLNAVTAVGVSARFFGPLVVSASGSSTMSYTVTFTSTGGLTYSIRLIAKKIG
jgi:hypothetical protein